MDLDNIKESVRETEKRLKKIKQLLFPYRKFYEKEVDTPEQSIKIEDSLKKEMEELEKYLPTGFSLTNSRLKRHLAWNELADWADIYLSDIPDELSALDKYKEKINCLDSIQKLHPEVNKFLNKILHEEFDEALVLAFRSIDIRLKERLEDIIKGKNSSDSVKKAFGKRIMRHTGKNINQDAVRDFITGVLGVERNFFIHNKLKNPSSLEMTRFSLKKLTIASETHALLDECEIKKSGSWVSMEDFKQLINRLSEQ